MLRFGFVKVVIVIPNYPEGSLEDNSVKVTLSLTANEDAHTTLQVVLHYEIMTLVTAPNALITQVSMTGG